jgi:hypothetical protein
LLVVTAPVKVAPANLAKAASSNPKTGAIDVPEFVIGEVTVVELPAGP